MSKHDTWVQLKTGNPFEHIEHLFPKGFPMRDPWGMGRSEDGKTILWFMDMDRLSEPQKGVIAINIAEKFGVSPQEVIDESPEGFLINGEWIESMAGGTENYRRSIELANFLEAHSEPNRKAYEAFYQQQYRDWIHGDRVPEPMPENYEDVDPRMQSPALEKAYKQIEIDRLLAQGNYSVFDVLSGKAMIEVLNQIDPDNEYSLSTLDDCLED
ncbi:MAG: hypothetical protein AAF298_00225 [Cyanobacteria bacterium P01_A01_bin.40]